MHPVVEDTCRKMTLYIINQIKQNSSDGFDAKQVYYKLQRGKTNSQFLEEYHFYIIPLSCALSLPVIFVLGKFTLFSQHYQFG